MKNNWKAHYDGTGVEIPRQLPGITHFVTGLGTTGSFIGTGRRLKKKDPTIRLISLQPDNPLHGMEGWKHLETAVVPQIYDPWLADENLEISTEQAYEMIKTVHDKEGLILSPSSAANLVGALRVASLIEKGIVVTLLPDNADKYGRVKCKTIIGNDSFWIISPSKRFGLMRNTFFPMNVVVFYWEKISQTAVALFNN